VRSRDIVCTEAYAECSGASSSNRADTCSGAATRVAAASWSVIHQTGDGRRGGGSGHAPILEKSRRSPGPVVSFPSIRPCCLAEHPMTLAPRVTSFLIAASLLAACSNQTPESSVEDSTAPSGTEPAPAPAPPPAAPVSLQEYVVASASTGGNCALDAVNGSPSAGNSAATGSQVAMSGWIADAANAVPDDALLVLTGTSRSYSGALPAGVERPDVAAALSSGSAQMSGYNVDVSLQGVEPGDYTLTIVHGGTSPQTCNLGKTLSVTPAA